MKKLEDRGVTDVIVGFRNPYLGEDIPVQDKIDTLRAFAESVIVKV